MPHIRKDINYVIPGIIFLCVLFLLGLYSERKEYSDIYLKWFGLNAQNTVYDYHVAGEKTVSYWLMHVCDNGECLTERDWACGYENGQDDIVSGCFIDLTYKVPVWFKLDTVRKICGNKYKVLSKTYLDEKRCLKFGGPQPPVVSKWLSDKGHN